MNAPIGKCNLCGGWVGVEATSTTGTPHCFSCGAIPRVPIIEMERPRKETRQPYMEDIMRGPDLREMALTPWERRRR